MSIPNGIQHPENFYAYGFSWLSEPPTGYSWYNLWSTNNTTTGFNDNAVVKTVYDPCPAGLKMSASNAFTGFTTAGNNTGQQTEFNVSSTWSYGWNFNNKLTTPDASVYFPASGSHDYPDGSLRDVGSYGNYWSAVPYDALYGCYLNFVQLNIFPLLKGVRSYGFSVRPVAE